jgi:fibronectin-binding autotransporter adhesin
MTQSQPVNRIFRKSTTALIAAVMAVGLLASASRGHAQVTLTWTNGNDVWNSTTAWQTNVLTTYTNDYTGGVTNQITNAVCQAVITDTNSVGITNCVGGTGGFPSIGDTALFTNNTNPKVTVTGSTSLRSLVFTNTTVTIGANASATTLTVTDTFRIAQSINTTATVYWAGGTLAVTNNTPGDGGGAVIQIGTGTNSVGALFVTNGTVLFDPNAVGSSVGRGLQLGGVVSVGKLVISGTGVVTNRISGAATLSMNGGNTTGSSQLIITNGGRLFMSGATWVLSNGLVLVSDSSFASNFDATAGSGQIACGAALGLGRSVLIVSNGATVWGQGTISIGRAGSAYNTGIVVGAGSKLIVGTNATAGFVIGGTAGANSNDLVVYNGGFVNTGGGTLSVGSSATCANNSFHMGGIGAMSTGVATFARCNTGASQSAIVVSNAVFATSGIEINGTSGGANNTVTVLANATVIFSNQYAVSSTLTNVLNINCLSGALTINAGTVNAVSGSNVFGVVIGADSSGTPNIGNVMTISNGGKLLSESGTIGSSSSFNTGVVTGVGTVWSNYTAGANYVTSNAIYVGGGTEASGNNNYLAVQNGATLVNNGSLNIGNSAVSTLNSVVFGGSGQPAVIINSGMVNIGSAQLTSGNTLTISNASLSCDMLNVGGQGTNRINNTLVFNGGTISANYVRVRSTNTATFTAGTLSAGGMTFDTGANNNNAFIVGDGTSAAYYDMSTNITGSGTGYHDFNAGGLVVANNAFLRGSGTLNGTVTVLGTFVPGFANSVGSIFTSNSLTFSSAVLNYDLGTLSDSVTINGNLALGGSTVNVTDSGGFAAGTYVLFTHTNTVSGTLNVGTLPNGFSAVISNDLPNTPRILLVVTSIAPPDPYTAWANHYFPGGGPNASGNAIPSGDGVSNTNKWLSGFNPTSAVAYAHVISIAKQGAGMNVTYLGASGDSSWSPGSFTSRTNVLEFTTGMANGNYSNNFATTFQTNILSGGQGFGTVTNMVDPSGASGTTRYYRIRVLAP